jgi:hypothetical protein
LDDKNISSQVHGRCLKLGQKRQKEEENIFVSVNISRLTHIPRAYTSDCQQANMSADTTA